MENRTRVRDDKQRKMVEDETNKSPLQKILDDRAKIVESQTDDEDMDGEKNEFLNMHAKLKGSKS